MAITGTSTPHLAAHVVLKHDGLRDRWVVLAPERMLVPDEIAVEVLRLCDGHRSLEEVSAVLARRYSAPETEIRADVAALLQDLADKGFVQP